MIDDSLSDSEFQSAIEDMRKFIFFIGNIPSETNHRKACIVLNDYLTNHQRLMYHEVTDILFGEMKGSDVKPQTMDNIIENLEKMIERLTSEDMDEIPYSKKRNIEKAIWKLYDHVYLAGEQYLYLRLTSEEYADYFEKNSKEFEAEVTKSANTQLVSLVAIFTAVAFALFSGFSSLSAITQLLASTHIFKVISFTCFWGMAMVDSFYMLSLLIAMVIGKDSKTNENLIQIKRVTIWANCIFFVFGILFLILILLQVDCNRF